MKEGVEVFQLTRDVRMKECPWLSTDLRKGLRVYRYMGFTYGCIGPDGVAVTLAPALTPFFEVPRNALQVAA